MSDFQFVTPRISVGAALTAADLPNLRAAGITHVVDATRHDDSVFLTAPGFTVLYGNIDDDGLSKVEWFKLMIPWFLGEWPKANTKFNFHCDGGCNRGPSSCYAALISLGWLPGLAESQIRISRPQPCSNPSCLRYIGDANTALANLGLGR